MFVSAHMNVYVCAPARFEVHEMWQMRMRTNVGTRVRMSACACIFLRNMSDQNMFALVSAGPTMQPAYNSTDAPIYL